MDRPAPTAAAPPRSVGIMQPYFFPYLGYFHLIHAVDVFVLYDRVQFIKKGWVNRNRVLQPQTGTDIYFRAQAFNLSSNATIAEVGLDTDSRWKQKLLKDLHHLYRRALFFEETMSLLETIFKPKLSTLSAFNALSIRTVAQHLGIQTQIIDNPQDMVAREPIFSQPHAFPQMDNKHARIVQFCLSEGFTKYINPIGGMDLYKREVFLGAGLDLGFVKSVTPTYPQLHGGTFVPYLSILDTLMHLGAQQTGGLLDQYEVIRPHS